MSFEDNDTKMLIDHQSTCGLPLPVRDINGCEIGQHAFHPMRPHITSLYLLLTHNTKTLNVPLNVNRAVLVLGGADKTIKQEEKEKKKENNLRQPRIERGAHRWQRWILPLNH